MDFLDPQKQKAHATRLAIGYAVIGLTLLLGTTILLYQAYGFGIDRNGRVIQNGLVFFSSQPAGAKILVNGQNRAATNTRLILAAGGYTVQLQRIGYNTWRRAITVDGGSVERFDYPFLVPTTLTTAVTKQYTEAPSFASQSNDHHWLMIPTISQDQLDLYDLSVAKPVAKPLVLPTAIFAAGTATTGWVPVVWASDNRHVILQRLYQRGGQAGSEYVLLDRQDPAQSQNLTTLLGFNPSQLELKGGAYDQYYAYDQNAQQLFTATLKKPTPVPLLQDVLGFETDGTTVLYATADGAPAGRVFIRMIVGAKTYTIHESLAGMPLLALANYRGIRYVAVGTNADNKVFVYKDPAATLDSKQVLVPIEILKTTAANYVAFSTNARFVVAEDGQQFTVYDAETNKGYAFTAKAPLDVPQLHAAWMDGFHLDYVSSGKLNILDFDGTNVQALSAASPSYLPFFTQNYHTLYTLDANKALTSTPLLTPADQ